MTTCWHSRRRTAATMLAIAFGGVLGGCGDADPGPSPPALGSLSRSGAGHVFYEVYEPAQTPRGTMLLLHGGGWRDRRGDARLALVGPALAYRARGWRVVNLAYSQARGLGGADPDPTPALRDVVAFYDQVRRAFGGPVCAAGVSAGGHLAAMLAVERPALTCAVLDGAPLDLQAFARQARFDGRAALVASFGRDPARWRAWSPTLLWRTAHARAAVFASAADNDPLVRPAQVRTFAARTGRSTTAVLRGAGPGSAGAALFAHSAVRLSDKLTLQRRQAAWLDGLVPVRPAAGASPPSAARTCDAAVPRAAWRTAARTDRWRLLRAGAAWRQVTAPGGLVTATAGCSGSADRQEDGVSVWAPPLAGRRAPTGAQAAVELATGTTSPRQVTMRIRGALWRPADWDLGLFAVRGDGSQAPVARCVRARCRGLRLVPGAAGTLIAAPGTSTDPDRVDTPAQVRFALPAGTRAITWRLRCVAAAGCLLTGPGRDARTRDPVGHPAILSTYETALR